jgi:hypothetical protein
MDAGFIVSLLGLLIATASLAVDVVAFAMSMKKGKRPNKRPPPDS